MRGELREAVGQADGEPRDLTARCAAYLVGDRRADPEDLLGAREGGLPGLGQRDAPAGWLEQLMGVIEVTVVKAELSKLSR